MADAASRSGAAGTPAAGKVPTRARINVLARVVLATLGGYAASAGLTALFATALPVATTLPRSEAVVLVSMLGFIVYLVLLLWGFAEPRLIRLAAIQALLAAGGFGLASFIGTGG